MRVNGTRVRGTRLEVVGVAGRGISTRYCDALHCIALAALCPWGGAARVPTNDTFRGYNVRARKGRKLMAETGNEKHLHVS